MMPEPAHAGDYDDDVEIVAQHGPFAMMPTGVVATGVPTYDQWHDATVWAQAC